MRRFILSLVGVIFGACCAINGAHAAVVLSTSDTDALAGNNISMGLSESRKFFVWVSTKPGQTQNALSLNITSSNPSVLQATSSVVYNPGNTRWNSVNGGTLGDLVTNQRGFLVLGATGINTGALDSFALFSEVTFTSTAEGTTNLTMALGSNGVSVSPGTTFDATFGGGSVNVAAIPEPGSMAVLGIAGSALAYLRRRRQKKLLALA